MAGTFFVLVIVYITFHTDDYFYHISTPGRIDVYGLTLAVLLQILFWYFLKFRLDEDDLGSGLNLPHHMAWVFRAGLVILGE